MEIPGYTFLFGPFQTPVKPAESATVTGVHFDAEDRVSSSCVIGSRRAGGVPALNLRSARRGFAMKFRVTLSLSMLQLGIALTCQAQVAKPGPLRVGAAKVDITPSASELPKQYLGVLDHVYSRAIVIDNGATTAALVTVDVMSMTDASWKRCSDRIAAESGIPVKNLVLAGVGVHSSPAGSALPPGPGAAAPPVDSSLEGKIVNSVKLAKAKLQPARRSTIRWPSTRHRWTMTS